MTFLSGETVDLVALDPADDEHVEAYRRSRTLPTMRGTGWYGGAMTPARAREELREKAGRDGEARCAVVAEGRTVGWARVSIRDDRARRADLGYYVLPAWQGRGYASEAGALLTAYAFEELNAHKVEAFLQADNPASERVVEKLGYRREATIRDRMYKDGEYVDSHLYGIVRDEFEA